jgi:hypothetical protein
MRYIQTNLLFRVFKKAFNVPVDWSNLRYFFIFSIFHGERDEWHLFAGE